MQVQVQAGAMQVRLPQRAGTRRHGRSRRPAATWRWSRHCSAAALLLHGAAGPSARARRLGPLGPGAPFLQHRIPDSATRAVPPGAPLRPQRHPSTRFRVSPAPRCGLSVPCRRDFRARVHRGPRYSRPSAPRLPASRRCVAPMAPPPLPPSVRPSQRRTRRNAPGTGKRKTKRQKKATKIPKCPYALLYTDARMHRHGPSPPPPPPPTPAC